MRYDAAVIGSGLSGLSCALLLARSGRRVVVLEQHQAAAPVVRGFSRQGLYFDSGFHYIGGLGEDGAFRPLFEHLGLTRKLNLFPLEKLAYDRLRIDKTDFMHALPSGYRALEASLCQAFPPAKSEIGAYLADIEQNWNRFPYLNLDLDLADFSFEALHENSLAERLQVFADHPELQSLLSMHSLLHGVAPDQSSVTLNTQVAGSYYHSAHGIRGGGQALVAALLELLEEAGVDVRCNAEVESITTSGGAVSGLRLSNGEDVAAAEVVATINPVLLPKLLEEGLLRPVYAKRLEGLRQTTSAYLLFGKIPGPIPSIQNSNLFLLNEPGVVSMESGRPLHERPLFVAAAGQVARNGCAVTVVIPAGYEEVAEFACCGKQRARGYQEFKCQLAEELKLLLVNRCPEFAKLVTIDVATPLTLQDYSNAPQGATYGVGHYLGQYNPLPMTRVPGLYLSGQAVAAPGLLGTVVSAYLTCGSILGHDFLRGEIKACC